MKMLERVEATEVEIVFDVAHEGIVQLPCMEK